MYDESRTQGVPALRVTMQAGISGREDMLDSHLSRGIYLAPLWEDPVWGTFLKMGSIKIFADGTLGGQTAWMRRPYRDKPETSGFPVLDQDTLDRFVKKAAAGGMQVLVHAIGDACLDSVLLAFEKVTEAGKNPLRHGAIHCQITTMDLLERMTRNKILALVQPIFLADDIGILESRVGQEMASSSYAWGSMHRLGIPVSYSTDAAVSSLDPLLNIQWAVLRANEGCTGYNPSERVDIYTAVDAYTSAAAFSNFDESALGRIAPGYLADLVFLDKDIFCIPPEDIHKARVQRTMIAGETVYSA
jgi:predicted amidohydrolase YtcJ